MNKVTVLIGKTENNYSAMVEGLDGFVCAADTFNELKMEVEEGVRFHIEGMVMDGDLIPIAFKKGYEFTYKWSTESLLNYYQGIFTKSALERLTGINQKQLWHYAHGQKEPRPGTRRKISEALHRLGEELLLVNL
jgi:predicted RNase H-like HicB family nuclease